jgi:hypothetical protein
MTGYLASRCSGSKIKCNTLGVAHVKHLRTLPISLNGAFARMLAQSL